MPALKAMFFDVGGTLGDVEPAAAALDIFPDTVMILGMARALGFRLGIITNVQAHLDRGKIMTMLKQAGIADFFDESALVTSTEAACFKPATAIYHFAADAIRLPIETCVYVDSNPVQVAAAVAAGMQGIRLRPRREPQPVVPSRE